MASATGQARFECGARTSLQEIDCNGNQLDALGTCGGTWEADDDGDGVCDDVDSCVGEFDACASATGQVPFTSVGARTSLQETAINGNQLDALGTCGGTRSR